MKWIRRILIVIASLLILAMIAGLMMPSEVTLDRSTVINAPVEKVFGEVNDFKKWEAWSPWAKMDPDAKMTYSEPSAGVGATMHWDGEKVDKGSQTITESTANKSITAALDFGQQGVAESYWTFEPADGATNVTWAFKTDMGKNPLARLFGPVMKMMIASSYESGLADLKALCEGGAQ